MPHTTTHASTENNSNNNTVTPLVPEITSFTDYLNFLCAHKTGIHDGKLTWKKENGHFVLEIKQEEFVAPIQDIKNKVVLFLKEQYRLINGSTTLPVGNIPYIPYQILRAPLTSTIAAELYRFELPLQTMQHCILKTEFSIATHTPVSSPQEVKLCALLAYITGEKWTVTEDASGHKSVIIVDYAQDNPLHKAALFYVAKRYGAYAHMHEVLFRTSDFGISSELLETAITLKTLWRIEKNLLQKNITDEQTLINALAPMLRHLPKSDLPNYGWLSNVPPSKTLSYHSLMHAHHSLSARVTKLLSEFAKEAPLENVSHATWIDALTQRFSVGELQTWSCFEAMRNFLEENYGAYMRNHGLSGFYIEVPQLRDIVRLVPYGDHSLNAVSLRNYLNNQRDLKETNLTTGTYESPKSPMLKRSAATVGFTSGHSPKESRSNTPPSSSSAFSLITSLNFACAHFTGIKGKLIWQQVGENVELAINKEQFPDSLQEVKNTVGRMLYGCYRAVHAHVGLSQEAQQHAGSHYEITRIPLKRASATSYIFQCTLKSMEDFLQAKESNISTETYAARLQSELYELLCSLTGLEWKFDTSEWHTTSIYVANNDLPLSVRQQAYMLVYSRYKISDNRMHSWEGADTLRIPLKTLEQAIALKVLWRREQALMSLPENFLERKDLEESCLTILKERLPHLLDKEAPITDTIRMHHKLHHYSGLKKQLFSLIDTATANSKTPISHAVWINVLLTTFKPAELQLLSYYEHHLDDLFKDNAPYIKAYHLECGLIVHNEVRELIKAVPPTPSDTPTVDIIRELMLKKSQSFGNPEITTLLSTFETLHTEASLLRKKVTGKEFAQALLALPPHVLQHLPSLAESSELATYTLLLSNMQGFLEKVLGTTPQARPSIEVMQTRLKVIASGQRESITL